MSSEKYANSAVSTLNGAINNSTTTVVVTSASLFPATGQFRIIVGTGAGAEIMLVTGVSSNTFTVTRAIDGSSAQSHSNLDPVTHVLTKGALDQIFADNCQYGACGSRPSAERAGRLYFGSDSAMMYRDNGSTWNAFYKGSKVTTPVTGSYTWTHGGATATNTDITNGPSLLNVLSTGTGDKLSTFLKNLPATPCSVVARVSPQLHNSTSFCGICMSDGTKMHGIGVIFESGITRIWTPKYNTLTSFSGEYTSRFDMPCNYADLWLKLEDDGSNRNSYYSNDGINWEIFAINGNTDFLTATKGGVWVGTNAGTGANGTMLWISEA